MPTTIDAFAHVFPRELYEEMSAVHPSEELDALESAEHLWDVDRRLSDMDEFGIDKQVLTLARPPIWRRMDPSTRLELTRLANDSMREYADTNPDRFIPVGTIPSFDAEYAAEAERCMTDLDMAGVQLFSNVGGRPIDSAEAEAIFERIEANDGVVWLHPQLHDWYEWDSEFMLHKMLGWPFDTSLALCRLVFSGIMARHPDLQIVPHHMGGMIPHFANRIDIVSGLMMENPEMYPYDIPELDDPPIEYFKRFTADTVRAGSPSVLEGGVRFFGEDGVAFATDYPFGPDEGRTFMRIEFEAVEEMDVDESTRRKIFGGNIASLLNG